MSQALNPQTSVMTDASLEMSAVNDIEIEDIMDMVNNLNSAEINDEVNQFEVLIQTEMQNIYKKEIESTKEIVINSSINGETILSHCNNQQELEQYLNSQFAQIWLRKKQHCSKMANSILKNINQIKNYNVTQTFDFIAHFDIRAVLKAMSDGDWNEEKFKTSSKKEFKDYMATHLIPHGISITLYTKITAAMNEKNTKTVQFEEKQEEEEEEEEKMIHLKQVANDRAVIINANAVTPEPPSNNTFVNFSDWKIDKQELKFPTYISKALYYLSEDDILELLMDRAISKILSFEELWRDRIFCDKLYNDDTFKDAVDKIYKIVHNEETEYDFINDFIEKECSRQISNYQKEINKNNKTDCNDNNNGEENKYDENDENKHNLEVQISRSSMEIKSEFISSKQYKITILDHGFDENYQWALFRRKRLKDVYMHNLKTSGYWKLLTRKEEDDYDKEAIVPIEKQDSFQMEQEEKEKITDGLTFFATPLEDSIVEFIEDTGPIKRDLFHLNAILMFLQTMETEQHLSDIDKNKIKFIPTDLKKMNKPIITIKFENDDDDDDDNKEESKSADKWYDIYYWNACIDDNGVHAMALKNHLSKGKMEYYLRYIMGQNAKDSKGPIKNSRSNTKSNNIQSQMDQQITSDSNIPKKEILEWIWYDNDKAAGYKRYDLGNNVLKQLEASFHSNCSNIFPKQLNCNFNYLLIKEMTMRLKKRGKNVGLGYVLRFSYSNSDRAKIVNMEQLSVWKNAPQFARNVQRMINGRNSIFMYFSSNNSEYVDEWKNRYCLYTEAQQKYFWAHILAVSAATHYITVEIGNQVITFNYSQQTGQQNKNPVFTELNNLEIQKERRSYMEYPGFLITPQQFFHNTQEIREPDNALKSTFELLIKDARCVVLQKFNQNVNYNKRSMLIDLPKQYCPHTMDWIWRNGQQQFYCHECASLLQFAEFVRKFILEYEHPEVIRHLWPWYRNTFHHNDFIKYHNYISRYNLNTFFVQSDILQMKQNQPPTLLQFDGCFKRMRQSFEVCTHQIRNCSCCHHQETHIPRLEENIRYRRKFAARFLLGGWNICRNLNIIRQQLKIIFTQLDKENNEAFQQKLIHDELYGFFSQRHDDNTYNTFIEHKLHRKVTMHERLIEKDINESQLWIDEISSINSEISDDYHYECTALQLLTSSQILYFKRFISYCLKSADLSLNNKKDGKQHNNNNKRDEYYYEHFIKSWLRTPKWYTIEHDIILLRLGLIYGLNEKQYVSELNGINSSDYHQVLISSEYYDRDKPFYEFSAWLERWENIHHRLRYLTHCVVSQLLLCSPSIIDRRIPESTDRPFNTFDTSLKSVVFLDSIMYETHLKYCRDEKESLTRDRDSEFNHYQYNILPVARKRDPFLFRDINYEFKEILYSFDLYKHGLLMGQFIIDRLEMKQRKSLWVLLGTLLKRMPYHMSLRILTKNRDQLRRGEPILFDQVCEQVIDGTNFSVPVSLYLSSLMEVCAEEDLARHTQWKQYSFKYEKLASDKINTVESDHIISILLDSRIFMDEEGLLELALESRRLHFLNSETINGVISHMYQTVDFSNPRSNPSFKPGPMNNWQLFQLLLFKPFYFYLSPLGFSWTITTLFFLYCCIIGIYLNLGIHQIDTFPDTSSWRGIFELVVWSCGVGYICAEFKEYYEQGTTYFSVNLSNNIWDIALSIQFIILLSLRILGGLFSIYNNKSQKAYDILWGLQCVILAIRALRLFQTSTYLGPLLHVIGLMVGTLIKFLIIIIVTFCGFVIGIMYIANGDEDGDEIIIDQFSTINATSGFLFELAVGITDLNVLESFGKNQLMAQIYIAFFIIVATILLLNLLIALMTTEFEAVRELAKEESAYLKAQSCYDLKHRARYIPPPINWILYIFIVVIHIINFIPALISPNYLNIYGHLHRGCMNPLRSHCYRHYHHPHDRPKQQHFHRRDHNKLINRQQVREWDESNNNIMNTRMRVLDYYWKSLFAAWAAKPCCKSINIQDWKIHHVNCYNIVSNGTNNIKNWSVISIAEYFNVYEQCTQTTLDPYDKNLVAHLTSNSCIFCKYCNRSITTSPKHIKSQLITPFWVLADIISCWCFLIILYLPMIILLFFIGAIERMVFGSINDHHIMSTDDDDYDDDDRIIQHLSDQLKEEQEQNENNQNNHNKRHHPIQQKSNHSTTFDASMFNMLNAKKKRKLRDYGKQYYRKRATNFNYLAVDT